MGTIPAATATLTEEVVSALKDSGLDQMAVSLDFPRADCTTPFAASPGAFAKTMEAIGWAHEAQLPLQINTTICGRSAPYFWKMAEFVKTLGIVFWEVFFLVPTGRGKDLGGLTAEQCEHLFAVLYRVQKESNFIVKVTEAPHYRRYVAEREAEERGGAMPAGHGSAMPQQLLRSEGPGHTVGLAPRGVNAGNGFVFVSHIGDVFPSGFLPVLAGNVRTQPLRGDLPRLPDRSARCATRTALLGRCGRCEYRAICGGSRSRAFALTGSYFATDPWCAYHPPVTMAAAS